MTIEVKAKKSEVDRFKTFVAFTTEILDREFINLIVEDKDIDNLTDLLDRYEFDWRLV